MTYHLVDRFDNGQHLVVRDLAVTVNIVQLERPVELVLHLAAGGHRQRADELLEINHAAVIRVKHAEYIIGK